MHPSLVTTFSSVRSGVSGFLLRSSMHLHLSSAG
ncbi:rCG58497 [Rattus norvegicus]|uniref:RCG58497 n=1 Tax=Rattus norvegicus TaxID=10116 RepID=A6K6W0_RAT|nr:rCG58497 [Rattus norvegicus]